MSFLESIRLALESIKVNKMRSVLTMLGIIIGISSVITITTIGSSLKATIASSLNSFGGTNVISCYVSAVFPENDADWETWEYPKITEEDMITMDDIEAFESTFDSQVKSVSISTYVGTGEYKNEDNKASVDISGNTGATLDSGNIRLLSGRDITIRDVLENKSTAVVSDWFVKYGCGGKSPIGKRIDISLEGGSVIGAYVVGVYEFDKKKFGMTGARVPDKDVSTPMYISFSLAQSISGSSKGVENFEVITNEGVDPTLFSQELKEYFNNTKYSAPDALFYLEAYDMASELGVINQLLNVITVAISIIAAISLLVGGIGVMNIMLVSVVERTREIGIRKALGAKQSTIKRQFLIESIVICLIGGFFGIVLGLLSGFGITFIGGKIIGSLQPEMSDFLSLSFRPSIVAIVFSVGFSMLIGMIFGSYPAKRAAQLNPIDALRYE